MTSLSHQAAEALIQAAEDPERNKPYLTKEQATEQVALIIAKVTGCDELLELLKQCEPIVEHDAQDLPYSPVLNTIRATLSRLQPQAPTNRNPDA